MDVENVYIFQFHKTCTMFCEGSETSEWHLLQKTEYVNN
jgi:hypothetical protein